MSSTTIVRTLQPARKLTHAPAGGNTFHPLSDCKYSSRPPGTRPASRLLAPLHVQLRQRRFDVYTRGNEHVPWKVSRSRNLHKQRRPSSCHYLIKCESSTFPVRSKSSCRPSLTRCSFQTVPWRSPSNDFTTSTSTSPLATLTTTHQKPASHEGVDPQFLHTVLVALHLALRQGRRKSGTQKAACSSSTPWTRRQ